MTTALALHIVSASGPFTDILQLINNYGENVA